MIVNSASLGRVFYLIYSEFMNDLIKTLNDKGTAITKTDTIYGILGSARSEEVVERIYKVKERDLSKPLIVLLSDMSELQEFGIHLGSTQEEMVGKYWPGPYTFILETDSEEYEYIHRGTKSIAFRIPDDQFLIELLKETGPLVAPSANKEDNESASSIQKAEEYFGDSVDYYYDRGECINTKASKIYMFEEDELVTIRD